MISSGLATMAELGSIYGAEDLYNFLEIIAVNAHNKRLALKRD